MDVLKIISQLILLLVLAVSAWWDIRTKTVPVLLPAAAFCVGLPLQIIIGELGALQLILGCAIGLAFFGISFLSRGKIGPADGLLLTASGACLGFADNLWLSVLAFAAAGVSGLALLAFGKAKGKSEMPFAPCLLFGYVILLAVG